MEIITLSQSIVSETHLNKIISVLEDGGTVAHPTETVYGLAVNIYDERAIKKLLLLKERKDKKTLSIMVRDLKMIESIVGKISNFTRKVLQIVLPGPVTIILTIKKSTDIPYFLKYNSIGFRIPDHYLCQAIMDKIDFPIATTSANKSGAKNPRLAEEVLLSFGSSIDLLIDGGKTQNHIPSTVIDLRNDQIKILREGAYDIKNLKKKLSYE